MARKIRIEYAGAAYHVMARGNQGRDIYGEERDSKLRHLLPTNQGVAASRPAAAEPPAERGRRTWRRDDPTGGRISHFSDVVSGGDWSADILVRPCALVNTKADTKIHRRTRMSALRKNVR
jgi:hypothetical protein